MKLHFPTWAEFVALFIHGGKVSNIIASLEAHIVALEHAITHNLDLADKHATVAAAATIKAVDARTEASRAASVQAKLITLTT